MSKLSKHERWCPRAGLLLGSFIWRDLIANRVRTALSVLGIALGVAVVLAINLANDTALSRFEESINLVAGKSNLEITANGEADLPETVLLHLKPFWERGILFTPVIDQLAVVPGEAPDMVQVLGVDMFADPAFRPFDYGERQEDGAVKSAIFEQGGVYVGERFARRHRLRTSSLFPLLINDKKRQMKVEGIISFSGPGEAFGGNLILMDIGPAQEAFGMRGRLSRVDLIAPAGQLNATSDAVRSLLPAYATIERPSRRGKQVEKMLAAFRYNLAALSLIALLVGMFVIYNTMSISVVRKRAEIGVLRALGTSRRRVLGIFLVQALLLGASGSLAGLVAGCLFARLAVRAVSATVQALYVDQPAATVALHWQPLAGAFVLGVALTAIAALAPALEAASIPPAEAARRGSFERRVERGSTAVAAWGCLLMAVAAALAWLPPLLGFPFFGYLSAALIIFGAALCLPVVLNMMARLLQPWMFRLFGSEGKFAILGLSSALGRTSVAVASLMLGIAMMVSLAIMIGSFRQTVIVWVRQSLKADLYVAPLARDASKRAGRLMPETVERIRRLPGVADVDAFVEFPIEYNGNPTNLAAADLDVLSRHGGLMFAGGRRSASVLSALKHTAGCIVSESFSLRNNISPGDSLVLESAAGPWKVPVLAVYYDYASDSGYIILPRWLYRRHYQDLFSSTAGVYLAGGADINRVRSELVSVLGANTALSIRTNRELRHEVLRIFDNTFAITYALHAVSIMVAILGVMNALFALTFESRREFALLSCLGASFGQIRKIILVQAGTLGLLGNIFGIAMGFILSLLLINVINKQSFGWTIQLSMPLAFLCQSFLLVLAAAILSGWLPARSAAAFSKSEVLSIE